MNSYRTNLQQVELPDGRALTAAVSGPEDGPVLVFHHGTPGSYHELEFHARAVHARGWRRVSFSRPGCPGSTRKPGRSVADVAADTAAVLDALGVQRALVGGASGGGPHALACAALLPDRIAAALVVCGVAPYAAEGLDFLAGMGEQNVTEFGLALQGEEALRPYVEADLAEMRDATPQDIVDTLSTLLPEVDRACITGELGEEFADYFRHSASESADGWIDDDLAFTRPWGFDLESIHVPVSLWHGTADLMVPFAHGQWVAEHVPGVRAHLREGDGHISITVGAVQEMLADLATLTGDRI